MLVATGWLGWAITRTIGASCRGGSLDYETLLDANIGVTRTLLEESGALSVAREAGVTFVIAPTDSAWMDLFAALGASPESVLSAPAVQEEIAYRLVASLAGADAEPQEIYTARLALGSFLSPEVASWGTALSIPSILAGREKGDGITLVRGSQSRGREDCQALVLPRYLDECSLGRSGGPDDLCMRAVESEIRSCWSREKSPDTGRLPFGPICARGKVWGGAVACNDGAVVVVDSFPLLDTGQAEEQFRNWLDVAPTHRLRLKAPGLPSETNRSVQDVGTAGSTEPLQVAQPPPGGLQWCGAWGGIAVAAPPGGLGDATEASVSVWILLPRCPVPGATVLRWGDFEMSTAHNGVPGGTVGECEVVVRAGEVNAPQPLVQGLRVGGWTHLALAGSPGDFSVWIDGSPAGGGGLQDGESPFLLGGTISAGQVGAPSCVRDLRVYRDKISTEAVLRIYYDEVILFEPKYAFPLMEDGSNSGYRGGGAEVMLPSTSSGQLSTHSFTGDGLLVTPSAVIGNESLSASFREEVLEVVESQALVSGLQLTDSAWTLMFFLKVGQPALDAHVLMLWDEERDPSLGFVLDVGTVWGLFPQPGEELPLRVSVFFGSAMSRTFGISNEPMGFVGSTAASIADVSSEVVISDEALEVLPGAWQLVTITLEPSLPWRGFSCLNVYLNATRAAPTRCEIAAPEAQNMTGALGLAETGFDGYIRDMHVYDGTAFTPDQVSSEFERRLAALRRQSEK